MKRTPNKTTLNSRKPFILKMQLLYRAILAQAKLRISSLEGFFWLLLTAAPALWHAYLHIRHHDWGQFGSWRRLLIHSFGSSTGQLGLLVPLFIALFYLFFRDLPIVVFLAARHSLELQVTPFEESSIFLQQSASPTPRPLNGEPSMATSKHSTQEIAQSEFHASPEPAKLTSYEYLSTVTMRSQRVAKDSLKRAIVHLFGGIFIGAAGIYFFFVITATDEFMKDLFESNKIITRFANNQSATAPLSSSQAEQVKPRPENSRSTSESQQLLTPGSVILLSVAHSIPRITILIFVEVLAGFFLKQYRIAMEEYRYYESLARRRETLIISFLIRTENKDADGLKAFAAEILDQPITTLKQGETTMILESQKLSDNDLLKAVEQIFELGKKVKDVAKSIS